MAEDFPLDKPAADFTLEERRWVVREARKASLQLVQWMERLAEMEEAAAALARKEGAGDDSAGGHQRPEAHST